jgi:hypothetical protein
MTQKILHTDNDFRITEHTSGIFWFEHRCENKRWWGDRWELMWCDIKARDRECPACDHAASEGLQTAFWFLKEGSL